jgi:quaternary ammonium compound-resistance protein SugE
MSAWLWLTLAGIAEVAWSQSIKPTEGFTRVVPTLVCLALTVAVIYPLTRAMQEIPVGTAYTVFTGMGALGAVVLGIVIYQDPVSAQRIAGLLLVVTGVIVLQRSVA